MPILKYNGEFFEGSENETILDCLIRNNQKVSHSCRGGICQSCMLQTNFSVDNVAQKGLSTAKKESGFFLSCQQRLNKDYEISAINSSTNQIEGEIISQQRVTSTVVLVSIKLPTPLHYKAGQFVNIIREDGLCRSYSVASTTPTILDLHIRKTPAGAMSSWFYDLDLVGKKIKINGPIGECYLNTDMFNDNLLLLGVGTGLAPLYGILQDAFSKNFKNPIALYHGGLTHENLYLIEELKSLEEKHENFTYYPATLKGDKKEGFLHGDLIEIIKDSTINIQNTTAIICGDPEMVKRIKQTIFMKGLSSKKILSDSFVISPSK